MKENCNSNKFLQLNSKFNIEILFTLKYSDSTIISKPCILVRSSSLISLHRCLSYTNNSALQQFKSHLSLSSKNCIHLPINISQCSSDRTNAHVLIYILKSKGFDSKGSFWVRRVLFRSLSNRTFFPVSLNSTGKNALIIFKAHRWNSKIFLWHFSLHC